MQRAIENAITFSAKRKTVSFVAGWRTGNSAGTADRRSGAGETDSPATDVAMAYAKQSEEVGGQRFCRALTEVKPVSF